MAEPEETRCPQCGAANRAGGKFCAECGAPLLRGCAQCGNALRPGARFCDECGASVDGAPVPRYVPRPERTTGDVIAERRLVSVVFADLVGFTTLSERRDPEEVRELLTRYFDTCRQVIGRYGGVVEKFIGDAVMAVWGTPTAREDDAERAVRAALELTTTVAALGAEVNAPELRLRAGVVTGEAAITVGAEGQGMVAGDIVNTASRIQSVAQPGTVLVDDATRRTTEAPIAYEDTGSHTLKGKAESVRLWRAERVVATIGGAMRGTGLEAPFVGRDRELRLLKELFHATVDEGRARLVSIVGLAGIGKSRLAWEFEKYIDGLADSVLWHRGRCLSYGEGVTYWALAEMVRRRCEIVEGEDQATTLSKLTGTLEMYVPDADERRWLEPRLANLLGAEERTTLERVDLFAAWRLFFERLSEKTATVLVFEEMQWADTGLVDFIEYLLEWSRHHALFVVTLARPDLTARHPSWGSAKRSFHSLYLEPLSPDAMDALLSGLVPGLPPEVRARIRDRAEGIPLYAVETVRMLLDRGTLQREGNRFIVTGAVGDLEVPETLHALIAARLDALTAAERSVLQDAAVLGQSFSKERLGALARIDGSTLDSLLESLMRKEILAVQADPQSPERGQYTFLQALVQKVAYDTLSRRERKARHLEVARHLEGSGSREADELVEVIAAHYVEAYRAEPDDPDAPDIRENARRLLIRAGQRAGSLAAVEEAERYFVQAAELCDQALEGAELLERAGEMAWKGGRAAAATSHYTAAIERFEAAGLSHPAARVSARLGEVLFNEGRIEEAVEQMEASFAVLSADPPDGDLAALTAQLARFHYFLGHVDKGWERIEFALDIAEGLEQPETLAQALITKSIFLGVRGRPVESMGLLQEALRFSLEHDIGPASLRAYYNLIDRMGKTAAIDTAITLGAEGVALARRLGDRYWEWSLLSNVMYPLYVAGRWNEALQRAMEMPDPAELGSQRIILAAVALQGLIHLQRGDTAAARHILEACSALRDSSDIQDRSAYNALQAALLNADRRPAEAYELGRAAFDAVAEMGPSEGIVEGFLAAAEGALAMGRLDHLEDLLSRYRVLRRVDTTPYQRTHARRLEARLAAARGDDAAAAAAFSEAEQGFRELRAEFGLASTLVEHGEWLVDVGEVAAATRLLDEARPLLTELGATPWLQRIDQASARAEAGPTATVAVQPSA